MSKTVAQIAAQPAAEVAYLFVMQGVPWAFADRAEIVGTGGGSWIGTGEGPRSVIEGLGVPESITFAVQRQDGRPDTGDNATFTLTDFGRELIAFFAEQPDAPQVAGRLGPKDDPAPAILLGMSGYDVPIWGKWVNGEAIGPAGERSYYSIFPGGDPAGFDHANFNSSSGGLVPSVVYPSPPHLEGRRCALYRIFRNPDTGAWPSWADQYESGESLLWVGTVTEATAVSTVWELSCDGPSSWLRRQIGGNRPATWQPVGARLQLETGEALMGCRFWYQQYDQPAREEGAESLFDAVDDVLPISGMGKTYRKAINDRLDVVKAIAGPDITFSVDRNADAGFDSTGFSVRIDKNVETMAAVRAAFVQIALPEMVWRVMGYDVVLQKPTDFSTKQQIRFVTAEDSDMGAPAGFIVGTFSTVPLGFVDVDAARGAADNGGADRYYLPINAEDPSQMLPGANFEVSLGFGDAPGYTEGQTNRAPADYELAEGGGQCDATGYMAFRGSYRASMDAETVTMCQVAKVSWHADVSTYGGDVVGTNDISEQRVFVEKWIDPRYYGIANPPLDKFVWAVADLEYAWVNVLGHVLSGGDRAHCVLLNLLLSSGTATWTGYEGEGEITPGANASPDVPAALDLYNDSEIADLGLGVPAALVDAASFLSTPQKLPGGSGSALNKCRYAFLGATDSQDLIASLLAPRGWGLGWCRAQWRLFSMPELLTADDAEVTIGPDDFASPGNSWPPTPYIEKVNLRPHVPRERFAVDFGRPLVDGVGSGTPPKLRAEARAMDHQSRTRHDNGADASDGWGLIPRPLWRGENPPARWEDDWITLFGQTMGAWYNSPYVLVEDVPVLRSKARQLGPGTVVRFSSNFAPGREGVYGLTNKLGRVFKVTHDLDSGGARIDVLVQPGTTTSARRFAPAAMLLDMVETVEGAHDATSRTLTCYADAFGHGEAVKDVAAFAEPAWLGVGGDAIVHGWQHDGRTWQQTFAVTVESVSAASNTITYKPESLVGKIWEASYTLLVLAPYDDQPADSWPRALFAVITRPDFKFGAGDTPGFKIQ